jgi:hypothetical protein
MPLRERDPEEFGLRVDELLGTLDLMRAARATVELGKNGAPAGEVERSRGELRGLMDRQFEMRTVLATRQISRLRERLDNWQRDLDKLRAGRDALVDKRVEEMLRAMERAQRPRESGPRSDADRAGGAEGAEGSGRGE